jgi:hypothetical protein
MGHYDNGPGAGSVFRGIKRSTDDGSVDKKLHRFGKRRAMIGSALVKQHGTILTI